MSGLGSGDQMISALKTLFGLFSKAQKRSAVMLVVVMIGGMVLETLGIGMIVPAVTVLTQPDLKTGIPWLGPIARSLSQGGHEHMVVIGMLALAAIYALKTAYVAWATSQQMRFVYGIQADLSQRLFVGYLYKPYTFHLERNSAQLIRNVVNITNELTLTGLLSLLILATEVLVLTGIGLLLLYVEPVGTICAALLLAGFGWMLNRATRAGIRRAGEARHGHEEMRIRYLQQAIGGAKELKLLGREQSAVAQYAPHNEASARIGRYQATLQALPKLWLELLAVMGLVALVVALIWQGKAVDALLPTIGMFAAAAFRLIPSVNRILGSVQFIRFSLPTIDALHDELEQAEAAPTPTPHADLPFTDALTLEDVSVRYPSANACVITGVNLVVQRGTTIGFIGESGAGKSTLVDAILGLLPLDHGRILSDGVDINSNLGGWQRQIGYVPQSIYLTDDSLRRNIAFGLPDGEIDEESVRRAVVSARLDAFVDHLPDHLDTVVGERGVRLSGGQRQRIGIARALYHNPPILVLDEATSSLDKETEHGVMQAIDAFHGTKTILIVTHRASTLEYCDRVVMLEHGTAIETGIPVRETAPISPSKTRLEPLD